MKLIRFSSLLFFLFLILGSCKRNEPDTIVFIGDSLIRNYDVEKFFPYLNTINYGVDGLSIKEMFSINYCYDESTVVLLIGTNDIKSDLSKEEINRISDEYLKLVNKLVYKKIICISILPRYDIEYNIIEQINKKIKEKILDIKNCVFLDISNNFLFKYTINPDYTTDGIHLSEKGYYVLSIELSKVL